MRGTAALGPRWGRIAAWAAGVFALDQASKAAVLFLLRLPDRGVIDVAPPFLVLRMAWNRGVNFGLLATDSEAGRWALVAVALGICALVLWWMRREGRGIALISAGVLIGGALGNVVDRVAYGAVADFLNMSCCGIDNPYVFNVADIAIVAGALGLALFSGTGRGEPPVGRGAARRQPRPPRRDAGGP